MKKVNFILVTIMILLVSLCACSKQKSDLVVMSYEVGDEYVSIIYEDKTYVPYGPLSAYVDRGKQIGYINGNENDKIYEVKGYSMNEWIATALPSDPAMLYKEISVTDIPEDWQSEYEWNQ